MNAPHRPQNNVLHEPKFFNEHNLVEIVAKPLKTSERQVPIAFLYRNMWYETFLWLMTFMQQICFQPFVPKSIGKFPSLMFRLALVVHWHNWCPYMHEIGMVHAKWDEHWTCQQQICFWVLLSCRLSYRIC